MKLIRDREGLRADKENRNKGTSLSKWNSQPT